MQVKTKGRLAVTAMIDLALHATHGPVALSSISQRQGISLSYLEQLFGRLRRQAIVESVRGPGGGYQLRRAAREISVAEIVAAVDVEHPSALDELDACGEPANRAVTQALWAGLAARMAEHLAAISLQSLVDAQPPVAARSPGVAHRGIQPRLERRPVTTNAPNSVFALGQVLGRATTTR